MDRETKPSGRAENTDTCAQYMAGAPVLYELMDYTAQSVRPSTVIIIWSYTFHPDHKLCPIV